MGSHRWKHSPFHAKVPLRKEAEMGVNNPKKPERRLLKHQAETSINPNHTKPFRANPNDALTVQGFSRRLYTELHIYI